MKRTSIIKPARNMTAACLLMMVATMLTTSLGSQVPLRPMELTGIVSYINTRSAGGVMAFAISAALYCATGLLIGAAGSWIDRKVRILR